MVHGKVKVDLYGWIVYLYIFEGVDDVALFKKLAKYKTGDQKETDDMLSEVEKGYSNGGLTVNYNNKTTNILIHPCNRIDIMLNVLLHEKRHTEDFIIEYVGIVGGESFAYLSGYLGENLLKIALKDTLFMKKK
jgi:hypothetical protein